MAFGAGILTTTTASAQESPIKLELLRLQSQKESYTNVSLCQAHLRVYNNTESDLSLAIKAIPQDILGYRIEPITELINPSSEVGIGELYFERVPAGRDRENILTMRGVSCDPTYLQVAIETACQNLTTQANCAHPVQLSSSARDDIGATRPLVQNGDRYNPSKLDRQLVQLLLMHPELVEQLELALASGTSIHQPPKTEIIIDDGDANGSADGDEVTNITIGGADSDYLSEEYYPDSEEYYPDEDNANSPLYAQDELYNDQDEVIIIRK